MAQIVKHLRIAGRVQGVGFRAHMQRKARELGVSGWVRNRLDGSVEAMAQGAPDAVNAIIAWARHGPRSAVVNGISIADGSGEYSDFVALPTE